MVACINTGTIGSLGFGWKKIRNMQGRVSGQGKGQKQLN